MNKPMICGESVLPGYSRQSLQITKPNGHGNDTAAGKYRPGSGGHHVGQNSELDR